MDEAVNRGQGEVVDGIEESGHEQGGKFRLFDIMT